MYYSAIGLLAALILLVENLDILAFGNKEFMTPSWTVYRRFLIAILVYYLTDIHLINFSTCTVFGLFYPHRAR
ncbi:MAG: hypothetical protein J6S63_06825 [Atopobiaceae bacterium]|nr:hypothetical protein [Atopobiaceae bacterium]